MNSPRQLSSADRLAVSIHGLTFTWPGQPHPTLDIPKFEALAGEHIFIEGPSGSGKSTLLALMAGILLPSEGDITVNGVCLNNLSGPKRDRFRSDHIGFIFQQFNLIPYLSILENVLIPCHFSDLRRQQAAKQAETPLEAAKLFLQRLDITPDLWKREVRRLSVGQQQRVAAARALIGKPSIIIADEPTSSLDADRREFFLQLLLKECRNVGASLFFVSHDRELSHDFNAVIKLKELNRASGAQ